MRAFGLGIAMAIAAIAAGHAEMDEVMRVWSVAKNFSAGGAITGFAVSETPHRLDLTSAYPREANGQSLAHSACRAIAKALGHPADWTVRVVFAVDRTHSVFLAETDCVAE